MNGYEVYRAYQALKLHFSSPSYDYFKYNGHTNTSEATFEKRNDKYFFHRIGRKINDEEILPYMMANLMFNPKIWSKQLLEPAAQERYRMWRKKVEALEYTFDSDMTKIVERLDENDMGIRSMFEAPKDGGYPLIWTMMLHDEISMETVVILHAITGMLDGWERQYKGDYLFDKASFAMRKYLPFLSLDVSKFKEIAKKHLTVAAV